MQMLGELGLPTQSARLVVRAAIDGGAEFGATGQVEVAFTSQARFSLQKGLEMGGVVARSSSNFVVVGAAVPVHNNTPEPAVHSLSSCPIRSARWSGKPLVSNCGTRFGFELRGG